MENQELPQPKKYKKIILISTATLLLLCLVGTFFGFKYIFDGSFAPGTEVANINLSFKDKEDALKILEDKTEEFLNKGIIINVNGKNTVLNSSDIGLVIDLQKTIDQVPVIDAQKASTLDLVFSDHPDIEIEKTVDLNSVMKKLDQEHRLSEKSPKAAGFYYINGELKVKKEQPGYTIDGEKILTQLEENINNLEHKEIKVDLIESLPVTKTSDIEPEKERILNELGKTITLVDPIYSDNWEIKLSDHPDWVSFREGSSTDFPFLNKESNDQLNSDNGEFENLKNQKISISLNREAFGSFIDKEISPWLDKPVEKVKVSKNTDGKIEIQGTGRDGRKIEREDLSRGIELALSTNVDKVTIPVSTLVPELEVDDELKKLGITERLSVGHSSYYNSPANRRFNISLGATKFNGHLLKPGEEFSFNTTLGPVEYSSGYKAELVIKGGDLGTRPEPGGGICQVSTTMYRAALLAGLDITDRRSHSYKVGYYAQVLGDGLDATIYIGGQDLKFKNNTKDHLLMQTYVEADNELYIVFYGTNPDGREVELEGPYLSNYNYPGPTIVKETSTLAPGVRKQVEKSHTGFDALWYRHIKYADGKTVKEPILSQYRAIPARVLVGAGAAAPTPAANGG